MRIPKPKCRVTLVNFIVGLAVLMVLAALVIPIFVPPEGNAATRTATPSSPIVTARR